MNYVGIFKVLMNEVVKKFYSFEDQMKTVYFHSKK